MVLRCAVVLEDSSPYYAAGGLVSGFIVLSTNWSDKIYGISIKLASKIEVDWDSSRLFNPYRSARNEDVSFHSDCQLILTRSEGDASCLANLVSRRTVVITRGVMHRYPFLLKIPKDIPSSFVGAYGHVSYKLVVFIRKPFREMYIATTKGISIAPHLDLNDLGLRLRLPVQDERVYYLSRTRTPTPTPTPRVSPSPPSAEEQTVALRVRLPHSAYVPDQVIEFEVEVDNRSSLSLSGARVVLVANTYFQIDQNCKVDTRTLLRCHGPAVQPNGRELWAHSFPCPRVLPTGLGSGVLGSIDLQYFLQFNLRVSDAIQLSSVIKLIVGTVPFNPNSAGGLSLMLREESSGDFLSVPTASNNRRSSAPPSYEITSKTAETPPPTYEEAVSLSTLLKAHSRRCTSCTDFE